jgi:hypothetical protein
MSGMKTAAGGSPFSLIKRPASNIKEASMRNARLLIGAKIAAMSSLTVAAGFIDASARASFEALTCPH